MPGDELTSAVVLLKVLLDSLIITVVGAGVLVVVVTTGVVGGSVPRAAEVELISSVVNAASVELGKPDVDISASVVWAAVDDSVTVIGRAEVDVTGASACGVLRICPRVVGTSVEGVVVASVVVVVVSVVVVDVVVVGGS